jgi:uncharacterized protein YoaH (UPF0181 family)
MTKYHPNLESRRVFLGDVGRSMVAASVGAAVANDLGFSTAFAETSDDSELKFGKREPLVSTMRDTPPDKLQQLLVKKLRNGEATLKDLTAAGALANARTFGGEDYDGFHCMFALVPALEMSAELPEKARPLPVLKVLYRNTARMQRVRSQTPKDVLRAVNMAKLPTDANPAELLRDAIRRKDPLQGDRILGALTEKSAQEAYDALQLALRDKPNVHAVALAHRAWEMVDVIGEANAHTLLRQSVHFSCSRQDYTKGGILPELQKILAQRLDAVAGKEPGTGEADDAWVTKMAHTIYRSSRAQAAEAVADALAEGISPEVVGEAIALAANEIILRQTEDRTHGDSRGVHSSDAVNAWRNIARVTNNQNKYASLIVAAYHVAGAGQNVIGPKSPLSDAEDPMALFRDQATETQPDKLLGEAEEAIRDNDQFRAAAAVLRYSQFDKAASRPVFDLLLKYALSEDGRLHAEKYYRTVTEEFASIRPVYRWRELVALARVTASTYGMTREDQPGGRAPGYLEARQLLGLS